jgi:hypothetical protein
VKVAAAVTRLGLSRAFPTSRVIAAATPQYDTNVGWIFHFCLLANAGE